MRPYFKANASVPTIQGLDQPTVAAYYKLNEASGNALDATTAANHLTQTGTVGADLSLFDLTSQGSRDFSSGNYFRLTSVPTEISDWAVLPNKSISLLFSVDAVGATRVLFDCGDGTDAYMLTYITIGGVIKVDHDGGGSLSLGTVTPGHRYLLVATTRQISKNHFQLRGWVKDLDDPETRRTYADGTVSATSGISAFPGAGNVSIGANQAGVNGFDGLIDEVVLWNHPLDETSVRELAKNYGGTTDEDYLYIRGNYATHFKVEIAGNSDLTGDNFVDMSDLDGLDFCVSADYSHDIDNSASEASINLRREFYKKSLSPENANLFTNSTWTGLKLNRRVRILVAVTPSDVRPTDLDFLVQWEGVIHAIAWGDENLTLTCKDRYAALAETMIRPDFTGGSSTEVGAVGSTAGARSVLKQYGSALGTDIRTVLKNMIDDNDPYVDSGGTATWPGVDYPIVVTPVDPSFNVITWNQAIERLNSAMEAVVQLIGWRLAYRFDENTRSFQLQLVEPERDSPSVQETFGDGEYLGVETVAVNIDMVINAVSVGIPAAAGDETETDEDTRLYWERVDSNSIDAYGYRWARIAEGSSSYLDSEDEAKALADAIVKDLRNPELELVVDRTFWRNVELNDYYQFTANGIHFTSNKSIAIYGYGHSFDDDGTITTRLLCRGRPAAKVKGWKDVVVLPGINPTVPNFPPADPAGAPTFTLREGAGLNIYWERPVGRGNRTYSMTEVHIGSTSGFSVNNTTLVATVRGTAFRYLGQPGDTGYIKVVHKDDSGNRTTASSASSEFTLRWSIAKPWCEGEKDSGDSAPDAPQSLASAATTYYVTWPTFSTGTGNKLKFSRDVTNKEEILFPKCGNKLRFAADVFLPFSFTWGASPSDIEFTAWFEVELDNSGTWVKSLQQWEVYKEGVTRNATVDLQFVADLGVVPADSFDVRIRLAVQWNKYATNTPTSVTIDKETGSRPGARLNIRTVREDE